VHRDGDRRPRALGRGREKGRAEPCADPAARGPGAPVDGAPGRYGRHGDCVAAGGAAAQRARYAEARPRRGAVARAAHLVTAPAPAQRPRVPQRGVGRAPRKHRRGCLRRGSAARRRVREPRVVPHHRAHAQRGAREARPRLHVWHALRGARARAARRRDHGARVRQGRPSHSKEQHVLSAVLALC